MKLELAFERRFSNLHLDYQLSLSIAGICGIFGPSGAGKSSLLRFIAGLDPESGILQIDGKRFDDGQIKLPAHQRRIGLVFQEGALFPHTRVMGNLKLAARKGKLRFSIDDLAKRFAIEPLLHQRVQALSGGQRQRVALVRALLAEPDLLLLDEPVSALDLRARFGLLKELKHIAIEANLPMLLVSHAMEEICFCCDQVLLIDEGRMVAQGAPDELFSQPDLGFAADTNACSLLRAEATGVDGADLLRVVLDGQPLRLPLVVDTLPSKELNETLWLKVRARDWVLTRQCIEHSSLFNYLEVEVIGMASVDPQCINLQLSTGAQRFLATLTRYSVERLNIALGDRLFAYVKAVSVTQ